MAEQALSSAILSTRRSDMISPSQETIFPRCQSAKKAWCPFLSATAHGTSLPASKKLHNKLRISGLRNFCNFFVNSLSLSLEK